MIKSPSLLERKSVLAAQIGQLIAISMTIAELKAREEWISTLVSMFKDYDNWTFETIKENEDVLQHLREVVHQHDVEVAKVSGVFPVEQIISATNPTKSIVTPKNAAN